MASSKGYRMRLSKEAHNTQHVHGAEWQAIFPKYLLETSEFEPVAEVIPERAPKYSFQQA
jgi:hypothetical protein